MGFISKHLKVQLIFLEESCNVLFGYLREIFSRKLITGHTSLSSRSTVNSLIVTFRLVDPRQTIPVTLQMLQFQFLEQPGSILLQRLQLYHSRVTDVTGNANLQTNDLFNNKSV